MYRYIPCFEYEIKIIIIIIDVSNFKLKVDTSPVHSSNQVKILGVTLDSKMTLDLQISTTCRSTYMHIRKINSIRKFLTTNAVKTVDPSTINCDCSPRKLDFSVSWVANEIDKETSTRSYNSAARLITLTSRFEHISPILKQLHWLPIHKRYQFKILVFVYKALHTAAPSYQCELLNWYQPPRPLRSTSTTSLVPNKNKTVRYMD